MSTEHYKAVRTAFREALPAVVEVLGRSVEKLDDSSDSRNALVSMSTRLDSLADSAGAYGMLRISAAARELQGAIRSALASRGTHSNWRPDLEQGLSSLAEAVDSVKTAGEPEVLPEQVVDSTQRLLLIGASPELSGQLQHYGYLPTLLEDPARLGPLLGELQPAAVILVLGEVAVDPALTHQLMAARSHDIPVVVMSKSDDFEARLTAVRAGGVAFLAQPVNMTDLVDRLEELTEVHPQPYRVVIVEDNPVIAAIYARSLEKAGMYVGVVTEPERLLTAVRDMRPDVILLDLFPTVPATSSHESFVLTKLSLEFRSSSSRRRVAQSVRCSPWASAAMTSS